MRLIRFVPKGRPALQRIKDYCTEVADEALAQAAYAFEDVFLGKRRALCKQSDWMGRGCFVEGTSLSYLIAKGVGPSPGSEVMRQMLDVATRRREGGRGGCMRLQTGTYYPLLILFRQRGARWEIADPRPEGFSMIGFLYREAEAGIIYNKLGIRALLPLVLLRHRVEPPWKQQTQASVESYLAEHLPHAIAVHLSAAAEPRALSFVGVSYLDMDGGILIRTARSPFRIANMHHAAVENDQASLEYLIQHTAQCFGYDGLSPNIISELGDIFTSGLARTAAALFSEGIIHGQLNVHYQNVSLAGEIADLDNSLFFRSLPQLVESFPFAGRSKESTYDHYWSNLQQAEHLLDTQIIPVMRQDFEEIVGIDHGQPDEIRIAGFMLRQIYDLYIHALRTVDLLQRYLVSNLQQPGTILTTAQIHKVTHCFCEELMTELEKRQSTPLLSWCLDRGYDYLVKKLLNPLQRRTIYGWASADVPINHQDVMCDEARLRYIHEEAAALYARLS